MMNVEIVIFGYYSYMYVDVYAKSTTVEQKHVDFASSYFNGDFIFLHGRILMMEK